MTAACSRRFAWISMKTCTSETAAGVTPGMREACPRVRGRTLDQRFLYLAGEAADRTVVEPLGNGALLGFLEAVDGALLLQKIAGVLDFGFDRLEFVAGRGRKTGHGFARIFTDFFCFEKFRGEFAEHWEQALDCDLRALEQLGQALADGGRPVVGRWLLVVGLCRALLGWADEGVRPYVVSW